MKTIKNVCLIIILIAVVLTGFKIGSTLQAYAQCTNSTTASELDLWTTFTCTPALISWHRDAYRIREEDWEDFGYNEPCNISLPYAKALNAAYLLKHGLSNNVNQWHSSGDYRGVGEALRSDAHDAIRYLPSETEDWLAWAQTSYYRTLLGCLLFNFDPEYKNAFNNPSTRTGDFIHEGWHHWQWTYYQPVGHEAGPQGNCTINCNACCDLYDAHFVSEYLFGEMHKIQPSPGGRKTYHSPNQAQVEYLCDLAEFAKAFVPTSVKVLAESEANLRLTKRFINYVGYSCGEPRPW
ncbi:hypothetical protein L0337_02435 [candidate division KSB1 bacterium]|nr:hypothetical protein [candidate division KSB1 bacterium]